ncbi:MAG: hypothetical protein SFW36_09750 [Leptolyngbyaceae cyanobacterium bins.59]|nr:hypothetical protein [Leptolyngbyaceae cyanobacterium bins.59]
MVNGLLALLTAGWIVAIAILSVQNATLVSLKFFTLQSIQIPVGVVLSFSIGVGILGAAIVQGAWNSGSLSRSESVDDYLDRDEADDW